MTLWYLVIVLHMVTGRGLHLSARACFAKYGLYFNFLLFPCRDIACGQSLIYVWPL